MYARVLCSHILLFATPVLACTGGTVDPTTSGATTSDSTTANSTSSSTTAATIGESDPSGSEGCSFIACTDEGSNCASSPGPTGSRCSVCSVWAQDCPTGEKCSAWANDGGNAWNATICVPVGPDKPGDPCTAEGPPPNGADSCELGAMCWYLDSETYEGTCVSLCKGTLEKPSCADPGEFCTITNQAVLNLCLPRCDPLLQDCAPLDKCVIADDGPICVLKTQFEYGLGEPCEFPLDCAPGLYCVDSADFPGCEGAGCCSPYCDHTQPNDCPGAPEQSCVPWYTPEQAPEGYDHLGICAIP